MIARLRGGGGGGEEEAVVGGEDGVGDEPGSEVG